jgi:hypothetical protein
MFKLVNLRVLACACAILFAGCGTSADRHVNATPITPSTRSHTIIDEHAKPTPALASALALTSVTYNGTASGLIAQTQKLWLRSKGSERWQVADRFADKRSQLMPLFDQMGLVAEIKPSQQQYDYVVLLGATVRSMRNRLAYVAEQWRAGVRFGLLVFLVGARLLDPTMESDNVVLNLKGTEAYVRSDWQLKGAKPATEIQAARLVYDQVAMPEDMQNVPVIFIDTPMQRQGLVLRRPNTADTVVAWLATKPNPGSCLVISNQPYTVYQDAVLRSVLPPLFIIETIGAAAPADCTMAIYLDTLARFLFIEDKHASQAH